MKLLKSDKLKFLKNRRWIVILGLILVVVIAGFMILRGRSIKANASVSEQRTAVAAKGTLSVTLSGSGTVSPTQKKDITVEVNGVIEESYLEQGKAVKAGDILLKLKDTDAQLALKKLENSTKQKEAASGSQNLQDGSLMVNAPFSGRVAELNVNSGDTVSKGAPLMTLVDESVLQLNVTFESAAPSQFNGVKTVQVQIPDFMASLTGQIKNLSQDGSNVHAVILVNNPGALKSGISAWAEIQAGDATLVSTQGTLEVQKKVQIKADAAGTISNLSAFADQKVNSGKLLLTITGDDLAYAIEGEQLDLEQTYLELEQARENIEKYTVRAPFDGVISSAADLNSGDNVKAGTVAGTVMNSSEMTFQVSIDELDISQVQPGQKVLVTAEALEETANDPIEGKVTSVASEGISSNGVTSYPVTVTIPGKENLKSGMNVDAIIQILSKENALLVPIEAVQKQGNGYIVWVKGGTQQAQQGKPNASSDGNTSSGDQAPDGQTSGRMPSGGMQGNLTEEQRQAMRQKFAEQGQGWPDGAAQGGASGSQNPGTGSTKAGTARSFRQNAASSYYNGAVPVRVTVGQHNETYMEITGGISEGDTIVLPELVSNSSSTSQNQGAASFMPIGGGGFTKQVIPNMRRDNND